MSRGAAPDALAAHVPVAGRVGRAWPHRLEDGLTACALAAMVLLPISEIALRSILHVGIPGEQALTQHLVLAVGMLGPALAAREGRLLTISTLQMFLAGTARKVAHLLSSGAAAMVCAFLCIAAVQFVLSEREAGSELLAGLPTWWLEALLPIGFALILVRLLWRSSPAWAARALVVVAVAAIVLILAYAPLPAAKLTWPLLALLVVATALGGPVFALLGGAALVLFWGEDLPIASLPLDHYRLVVNPSLPAVPLFTLAGYLLAESRAPTRLIRVFQTLFGGFRAGPACVTVFACAFFTAFTGASGVTILALGGLLLPLLIGANYRERPAIGLITSAGSLGVLLPPSLPLILFSVVAKVPLQQMFLAAVLPGLLMASLLLAWGIRSRDGGRSAGERFDARAVRRALWDAKWELATPVVAVAMLFGGFATPVEAAAVTAFYAFIITVIVHRDLTIGRDVPRVFAECGLLVGGVLLILGVALGLTNYLVDAQLPDQCHRMGESQHRVALGIPARAQRVPARHRLRDGCVLGHHRDGAADRSGRGGVRHRSLAPGVIFLANMELGFLTPLVGMNVIFAAYRFGKPMPEMVRAVLPAFVVLFVGVMLVTYLPWLTAWLPGKP